MKLLVLFQFIIFFVSPIWGSVKELSENYDKFVMHCDGKVVEHKITPLKFEVLTNSVAEYILKRAKIEDGFHADKHKKVEAQPNLEGDIVVFIGMRNKITQKNILILVNLTKDFEVIEKNEKLDEKFKNEFKALVKDLTKQK